MAHPADHFNSVLNVFVANGVTTAEGSPFLRLAAASTLLAVCRTMSLMNLKTDFSLVYSEVKGHANTGETGGLES